MLKHLAKSRRSGVGTGDSTSAELSSAQECPQPLDEVWVESFSSHIYREAVRRLRLHFSDETWQAFEATFEKDRTPDEVAGKLHRSVGWVYQAKSQVVRRLREEILYLAEDSVLLNGRPVG